MKSVRLLALLLLLPGFGGPPTLPDVSLDDLWFKLTLKCKGRAVESDGSDIKKQSVALTGYLHFALAELEATADGVAPATLYTLLLYTEILPDTWGSGAPENVQVVVTSKDQYIVPDFVDVAQTPDGFLATRSTLLIRLKRDKNGAVTSGKLSTLGGETWDGALPGQFVYGNVTLTGKRVDVEDLPFAPG